MDECTEKHNQIKCELKDKIEVVREKDSEHHITNRERIKTLEDKCEILDDSINDKMGWHQFIKVVSLFLGIAIASIGFLYNDLKNQKIEMNYRYEKTAELQVKSNANLTDAINSLRVEIVGNTASINEKCKNIETRLNNLEKK